eukprot:CAMPEP_0118980686 /NCGR_PEP_ID=MMETSP1173-20130426/28902_1 /TAXON_ID=1034831 /ORGANISM="Rhizochromulina marina cf, Strain CCMP1243" /LENGTH=75 /DNA_ID=CAMNT_0006931049 /DNA_START=124 /DNA_END=348 /DNA_ORIENTATION=-
MVSHEPQLERFALIAPFGIAIECHWDHQGLVVPQGVLHGVELGAVCSAAAVQLHAHLVLAPDPVQRHMQLEHLDV